MSGGHRVVGAEHRPQVAHPRAAAFDAFLVEVVAKYIHAIRAGQVVALVAVQIGRGWAAGGDDKGSGVQVLADKAAELEGHAVARRELQIGDLVLDFIGLPHSVGKALRIECGQAPEGRPALFADVLRSVVGPEELRFVILVVGYESGQQAPQPRVAGKRAVLGARELQAQQQPAADQQQYAEPEEPLEDGYRHTNPPWQP